MSKKSNRFSPEVRERAVRMVLEHRGEYPSLWATIESIAPKIGCVPQTLNDWVRQHEVHEGMRDGVSSDERARIKDLEREVKELRKANEILKLASVFFAQAEQGRRLKSWGILLIKTARPMGSSRFAKCCKSPRLATGVMLPANASPNCFAPEPNVMKP
jgi:transposase-like protein